MSQAHVHQLMNEIGPLLDLDELIEYPDQALWIAVFADGQVLDAEYDEAGARLLLSMELGAPPAGDAAALHQTLLQYNYLRRQTGGVLMALAGPNVVQMLELAAARLDLPTLTRALSGLHANAAVWRALLAPPSAPPETPPDAHALRA